MSKLEKRLITVGLAGGVYFLITLISLIAFLEDDTMMWSYPFKLGLIVVWTIMNLFVIITAWRK